MTTWGAWRVPPVRSDPVASGLDVPRPALSETRPVRRLVSSWSRGPEAGPSSPLPGAPWPPASPRRRVVLMRALPLVRARVPAVQWIVIGDGAPARRPRAARRGERHHAEARFIASTRDGERNRWRDTAHVIAPSRTLP